MLLPMTTMNISLPDGLKDYVDHQVADAGYSSSSEYVRDLIRQDQIRNAERELTRLIADGVASGPSSEVTASYWSERRAKLGQ